MLDFKLGTNVAGVLTGTDPALSDEFILVTAHHDHLGIRNGKMFPGACDNASGTAALMEIAARMSARSHPRRSVCFLSTDGEESGLLGALAFACRKDVNEKKIIANVNMDGLGRQCFESIDNALMLLGSENYPAVQRQARGACLAEHLEIQPMGSDTLGARADHVVFETLGIPAFFFTCGMYSDYHQPSDTANKIDYALLERQTSAIERTINYLADEPGRPVRVEERAGDREELAVALTVLGKMDRFGWLIGLPKETRNALPPLIERTQQLISAPFYSKDARQALWIEIWQALPAGLVQSPRVTTSVIVNASLDGMRHLQDELSHDTTRESSYRAIHYGTRDGLIELKPIDHNHFELVAYCTRAILTLRCGTDDVDYSIKIAEEEFHASGTREDLVINCLCYWKKSAGNPSFDAMMQRITTKAAGEEKAENYLQWVQLFPNATTRPGTTNRARN